MNPKVLSNIAFALIGLGLVACDNIGNAPAGKSADEMKSYVEKQPPEEQIKMIEASPAPPDQKAAKIAEVRKKYNLQDTGSGPAPSFPGDPRGGK